jgi:serine/threonine protein kinase
MKALAIDDPRVIGEYRLRAQLGAGGMGRVYLGLSPGGRAVAIKVVHPDLASDTEFLRRFSQEVAAARAVSGIYTAPVVASGLNERPPWLATAFVPGPSLDQVVNEHGPMPESALWPLLAGLVEALQAIHACRVVHRDLKPPNVLLAADGPRVIDFGISRAADGTALTAAGVVFGTPGYMSPEQAEGKDAGPESDVFALGCVISYAATGTGPFGSGTAAAVLYRVVYGEAALDKVPPQLREIVAGCLTKDPAARPTLRDLAATIARGTHATGPSAVAFWPQSVAGIIGAYQARLEQETRTARPADPQEFSWASAAHPPTSLSDPGNAAAQPPLSGAGTRWPHAGSAAEPGSAGQPSSAGWANSGSPPYQGQQNGQGQRNDPVWPGGSAPQSGAAPQSAGFPGSSQQHPGSQGFPNGPGWPGATNYPQPQGYGAQASQPQPPPPRGYLPASGGLSAGAGAGAGAGNAGSAGAGSMGVGYPQAYQPGSRGAIYALPASMATAVRLMYAGAAYSLIYAIGFVAVVSGYIKNHPGSTEAHTGLGGYVVATVVLSLVEIALWLGIARACKNRRNGARITGTVLFSIHTLGAIGVLGHSGFALAKVLTVISWLIACGAVVFLWQRSSSEYFRGPAR